MSKTLCFYAFDSLCAALNTRHNPLSLAEWQNVFPDHSTVHIPSPLFVTYTLNARLRGCIGTFAPLSLSTGIKRFALGAALHDSRFTPVTRAELTAGLEVSITLLAKFKPILSCTEWEIGTHGLQLEMNTAGQEYHGTFLPSVAVEQGWDHQETLFYLLMKAEYSDILPSGVIEFYNRGIDNGTIKLVTYLGQKELASYTEFVKAREELMKSQLGSALNTEILE